ncbi:peptidase, partial [candidate division KSB1 bacterium]|nr:peptidase [candidate division KSB1 bacterium]
MRTSKVFTMLILAALAAAGCGRRVITHKAPLKEVQAEMAKLAPVALECDLSQLTDSEKQVLRKLVQAGQIIDELFLLQVSPENLKIRQALQNPADQPYLEFFTIMFGPWNRLDHDKPFINKQEKPLGAGFYPLDMSKQEFTDYIEAHPDEAGALESTFTVIRRQQAKLNAIPYHQAYRQQVEQIASLLQEAAELSEDPTLKKYLQLRAKAFLTDDYFDSDMAWMDLAGNLEVVIGPYEVYEDNLFNYKAAYETFICIV